MSAEPIPHELLLNHAAFLRRLARDLVGDSASEDVVQEVWLRALEQPPRHDSNLRGWLRVVLTNLARSKARTDSRREARERERAMVEGQDVLPRETDRETMLRPVTEAVLALEEPLRSTVLQHYFHGLTLAEIAKREKLPASTVKSRLQRALEILRVRMKSEHGDTWQSAILALTLPAEVLRPVSIAGTGKGVILMTLKTKIVLGCAALLASALLYRVLTNTPVVPAESLAKSGLVVSDEAAPAKADLAVETKPAERAPIAPASASSVPARNERPKTLFYGTLVDPAGNLLHGLWSAGVSITDSDGRRRVCDAKDEGTFAFSALPYGNYSVSAGADGYASIEESIELDEQHKQVERNFSLHPAPILKVRVTTPEGKNLFDVLKEDGVRSGRTVLVPVATKERPGKWFTEVTGSLNNPFGIGHYWNYGPRVNELPSGYMGILMLDQELPAFASLVNYQRVLQTQEVKPGQDEVHFVLSIEELAASSATIRMRVVDAESRTPIAGATAALWGGTSLDGGERADANGDVVIARREPGNFDLRVQAAGHEKYRVHILADSGIPTELGEIALDKAIPLVAKVVDVLGAPLSESFNLGVFDSATRTLTMDRQVVHRATGDGQLGLDGLGRHVYVLRSTNHDAVNAQGESEGTLVSGNVVLDLRSGTPPANFVVTLVPATRMMLTVKGQTANGLRFLVTDEHGIDLVSSTFYGNGPRPLLLPQGKYRVALLDAEKTILSEQSVTLGATKLTVELTR
jgi:RNA polymerase sigma factor (sigma-70 family)